MKLLSFLSLNPDGSGRVVLLPEEGDDLWHLYNLIGKGDTIRARTWRKVEKMTNSASGSVAKERRRMNMTLRITKEVVYEVEEMGSLVAGAGGGSSSIGEIRFGGVNVEENEWVAIGANHTISVEVGEKIEVRKTEWDECHKMLIEEACDVTRNSEVCCTDTIDLKGLNHYYLYGF